MSVWSVDQVLALAPDASAQKAARGLAGPRPWVEAGYDEDTDGLWGRCQGSGKDAYQVCVELSEPAYKCSCPSRKFPCKHALGLLLRWAGGEVTAAEPPDWMREWQASRQARQEKATTRAASGGGTPSPKIAQRRGERVAAGLDELDRWLGDQVRQGLAGAAGAGYAHWERMAARLVDAQAPGAAGAVGRLAGAAGTPDRLLGELGLLRLLIAGYRRVDELPAELAATVRSRIGFPVGTEEVLSLPGIRDEWQVVGVRDEVDERLTTRRVWLRGVHTGRAGLVLSFAAPGQALAVDLVLGTVVDAELHFYPGALPLRALVGRRHAGPRLAPPAGEAVRVALDGYAAALARDPWLDRWPVLLDVVPVVHSGQWYLVDPTGDGLPLAAGLPEPWTLVAVTGGEPTTVAAEWGPGGLRPLTAWVKDQVVKL
jgi:hypothetical protein